mgnify:CR=1 FL=1
MRNRLIITISDLHGSKHFNIHQVIKKVAVAVILVTFITVSVSFAAINYLMESVSQLNSKKESLTTLNVDYEQRIQQLNQQIQQKSLELETFNDSLEDIELLIGRSEEKDLSLKDRVNLAKISSAQKHHILNSIPNGSPLKTTKINDKFGWRIHPLKKHKKFHKGIDLKAKRNTQVFAAADGIVEYAGFNKASGFGYLLIIVHNYGFKTYYAHLNKIHVKTRDIIHKGQVVALTGNTGNSSGPHLHYEVRYIGISIDPLDFIQWDLAHYDSIFTRTKGIKWHSLVSMIEKNQRKL